MVGARSQAFLTIVVIADVVAAAVIVEVYLGF